MRGGEEGGEEAGGSAGEEAGAGGGSETRLLPRRLPGPASAAPGSPASRGGRAGGTSRAVTGKLQCPWPPRLVPCPARPTAAAEFFTTPQSAATGATLGWPRTVPRPRRLERSEGGGSGASPRALLLHTLPVVAVVGSPPGGSGRRGGGLRSLEVARPPPHALRASRGRGRSQEADHRRRRRTHSDCGGERAGDGTPGSGFGECTAAWPPVSTPGPR